MGGSVTETRGRVAVIAELLRSNGGAATRRRIAHLLYLLAELEGVPLDYHFHLGTSGPDDPRVEADLRAGEADGHIRSMIVDTGRGEEILWRVPPRPRFRVDPALCDAIVRILRVFGKYDAVALADAATIVVTDRWYRERDGAIETDILVKTVASVRFADPARIDTEVSKLRAMGYLRAVL